MEPRDIAALVVVGPVVAVWICACLWMCAILLRCAYNDLTRDL